MLRRLRKWLLKRKAKRLYSRYVAQLEQYDCGHELAEQIDPDLATMRTEVEGMIKTLKQMDEEDLGEK